ncbi:MAG: hypothetical protein ACFFCW_21185 [Candidatus Hodarchaeota archaeon]
MRFKLTPVLTPGKKKGLGKAPNPLNSLVGPTGLEPVTSGM